MTGAYNTILVTAFLPLPKQRVESLSEIIEWKDQSELEFTFNSVYSQLRSKQMSLFVTWIDGCTMIITYVGLLASFDVRFTKT